MYEIKALNQNVIEVQEKLYETESELATYMKTYQDLNSINTEDTIEANSLKSELNEALVTLEELTCDFEKKCQECSDMTIRIENFTNQHQNYKDTIVLLKKEINELKDQFYLNLNKTNEFRKLAINEIVIEIQIFLYV